jgi:cysteine-rich repeat protein
MRSSRLLIGLVILALGVMVPAPFAGATTLIDADFDADAEGFSYLDDTFWGTAQPAYASGTRLASGGFSGGALSVALGGVDEIAITGMSGGWQIGFDVTVTEELEVTLRYSLTQSGDYESSELSQVMVSLDGTPIAGLGSDYVDQIAGDGNGGSPISTSWGIYRGNLGTLSAGSYTLTIGGYNSGKTSASEYTDILIDNVRVATPEPLVLTPGDYLVPDADLDALLVIDSVTGEREVVSSIGRGSGPNFSFARGVAIVPEGDDIFVVDFELATIFHVDPGSGNRQVVSNAVTGTGPILGQPFDVKIEPDGGLLITDIGPAAVVHVDPNNGNRTVVSSNTVGVGVTLVRPSDIWRESEGDLLLADGDGGAPDTVIRVTRVNGNRSYVSAPGVVGSGPNFNDLSGVISAIGFPIAVTDAAIDTIFLVDPNTGNRSILSDPTTGGGAAIGQFMAIEPEVSGDYMVIDVGTRSLLRVDPVTGFRTAASSPTVGSGPFLVNPRDVVPVLGGVCGDGFLHPGEQCDDGNTTGGDCCSDICQYEAQGLSCDDDDACTESTTCNATGVCGSGSAITCDDAEPCTDDLCYAESGCAFTPNSDPCSDGDACTDGDVCSAGSCQSGGPLVCNDSELCTDDSCNTTTGCVFTPNTDPCSDGDACTVSDICSAGSCQSGGPLVCDDSELCTDDSCNPASGCVFAPNVDPCDDGDACTDGDVCSAGSCLSGLPLVCDDSEVCTDDSCNPASGCEFTPNTAFCDDGDACSGLDKCSDGICYAGSPVDCSDGNVCTEDTCDSLSGCQNDPIEPCSEAIPALPGRWYPAAMVGFLLLVLAGSTQQGVRKRAMLRLSRR